MLIYSEEFNLAHSSCPAVGGWRVLSPYTSSNIPCSFGSERRGHGNILKVDSLFVDVCILARVHGTVKRSYAMASEHSQRAREHKDTTNVCVRERETTTPTDIRRNKAQRTGLARLTRVVSVYTKPSISYRDNPTSTTATELTTTPTRTVRPYRMTCKYDWSYKRQAVVSPNKTVILRSVGGILLAQFPHSLPLSVTLSLCTPSLRVAMTRGCVLLCYRIVWTDGSCVAAGLVLNETVLYRVPPTDRRFDFRGFMYCERLLYAI
ncbi:hypothetical protein CBL_13785 [Carabus blaptoides fortunei]